MTWNISGESSPSQHVAKVFNQSFSMFNVHLHLFSIQHLELCSHALASLTLVSLSLPFSFHVSHPMGQFTVRMQNSCLLQLFKANMFLGHAQFLSETPAAWIRASWYLVQPSQCSVCWRPFKIMRLQLRLAWGQLQRPVLYAFWSRICSSQQAHKELLTVGTFPMFPGVERGLDLHWVSN